MQMVWNAQNYLIKKLKQVTQFYCHFVQNNSHQVKLFEEKKSMKRKNDKTKANIAV